MTSRPVSDPSGIGGRRSWVIQFGTRENLDLGNETDSARYRKIGNAWFNLSWGPMGVKEPTREFLSSNTFENPMI